MVKHVEAGDSCDRAIGGTQLRQVEMLHDELIVVSCGFSCTYPTTPISSHSVLREWNANSTMTRNSRLYTMLSDEDMYRSQRIYASKNLGIFFFDLDSWFKLAQFIPSTGMASKKTCCAWRVCFLPPGGGCQIWSGVSGWSVTWQVWVLLFLTFWLVRLFATILKFCWCQLQLASLPLLW